MAGVDVYTISVDLPFGQKRWCSAFGVDKVKMLSDHRDTSFGANYGVLIKDARLLARALFVIGKDNTIQHVEFVLTIWLASWSATATSVATTAAGSNHSLNA